MLDRYPSKARDCTIEGSKQFQADVMANMDLQRTLDDALAALGDMNSALVAELQKANEDDAQAYVQFLDAQMKLVARVRDSVEKASHSKTAPFI